MILSPARLPLPGVCELPCHWARRTLPGPPIATSLADGRVLITWNSTQAELYDPGTGDFSATGAMTMHGAWADGYSATLLPNGKVLIAGGGDDDESLYASAELYDPQTTTFTATGQMAQPRGGHTATLLADGTVLIGGYGFSVELYDPASGTFGPAGNLTTQRFEQTATLLNSGQVLIAGGTPTTQIKDVLASAEIYTPARLVAAAVLLSLSGNGTGQGAIQHAETYQVASADNPAVGGEALAIYCTGLADGSVIPPQVAIAGRMAEVLWFGNTPGYTGLNQINVRVPDGVARGPLFRYGSIMLGDRATKSQSGCSDVAQGESWKCVRCLPVSSFRSFRVPYSAKPTPSRHLQAANCLRTTSLPLPQVWGLYAALRWMRPATFLCLCTCTTR